MKARISGVATYLPERTLTSGEVESRIEGYVPYRGVIERMTGIARRHVAADGQQASDLAVAAARELDHGDADLLIFASASQDMVEPATAHIVAAKLGMSCPVFDVKNACNSLLNGIQVAEALIRTGAHRKVLVCTGEVPSRAIRWRVADREQFVSAFAGYTLSDAGAAVLVTADPHRGIFYRDFSADSTAWAVGTLPGGGSAHPRDPEYSYFRGDGRRLKEAFELIGPDIFLDALKRTCLT
jgi:3-oxoacyl-[acyl-carrier-protein] synthase III